MKTEANDFQANRRENIWVCQGHNGKATAINNMCLARVQHGNFPFEMLHCIHGLENVFF